VERLILSTLHLVILFIWLPTFSWRTIACKITCQLCNPFIMLSSSPLCCCYSMTRLDLAWSSLGFFSCQCCPFPVYSAFFAHFFAVFLFLLVIFSCTTPHRVPEKEFLKAFKSNPRLKTKVNNFNRQMASNNNSEDEFVAIRPEWTTVDRILACRLTHLKL